MTKGRPAVYRNEEDKRQATLISKKKYANKKIECEYCNKSLSQGNISKHHKHCQELQ